MVEYVIKIILRYIVFPTCISIATINAQILQDSVSLDLIKKGIDSTYNLQFSYAGEVYNRISKMYPEHPIVIIFKEIVRYWENYPLLPNSTALALFEKNLRKCIRLCEKNNNSDYDAEYLMANLCARGLLLSFYTDNDLKNEVIPLATSTYKYIMRSFNYTSIYPDFFLFTGLYNYYREIYPKIHPFYKPFSILFPKGDRIRGIKDLQKASRSSILLKAESFSDLSYIYMTYENNYQRGAYFSKNLHDLYPVNPEFKAEYIKNLLLMKRYDEAENLFASYGATENNSFYHAQLSIFNGIILEKKYHNYELAQEYYDKGIRDIAAFGTFGNEYAAYAYFGLSRIAGAKGDIENSKTYHKQATRLADSKNIDFDE